MRSKLGSYKKNMTRKNIAILGSTGSIGKSALKVVSSNDASFRVVGLTTDTNVEELSRQIRRFKPKRVGIVNEKSFEAFMRNKKENGLEVFRGRDCLEKIATAGGVDLVLSGVVGAVGLNALLSALKMGRTVALANKESLIMAGELVSETAKKFGATILPVDSEHSAMFQCIQGQNKNRIHKFL